MNTHSVALKQIRLLYRWIIKGKLINFSTDSIFRHAISENARNALDTYLKSFDWSKNDDDAIKEIKAFVDFYNIGLAEELRINDMVWSQLVKRYFQNGNIIEVDESAKVFVAHYIFLRQIKSMCTTIDKIPKLANGNPAYKLNDEEYEDVLPTFISQLYHAGFHDSVSVIHQYLYFTLQIFEAHKVQAEQVLSIEPISKEKQKEPLKEPVSTVDMHARAVAVLMSPALLDGLELNGYIIGDGKPDVHFGKENLFLSTLLAIFLKNPHPIFREPYHSKAYRDLKLRQKDFDTELDSYRSFLRSARTSNIAIRELKLHMNPTPELPIEAMQHLLLEVLPPPVDLVPDKPIERRQSGFGGLLSRMTSREKDKEKEKDESSAKKNSPKEQENLAQNKGAVVRNPSPKDRTNIIAPKSPVNLERQVSFGRSPTQPRMGSPRNPTDPTLDPSRVTGFLPGYQLVALMPVGTDSPHLTSSPSAGVYMVPSTSVDLTSARRSNDSTPDRRVPSLPEDKPVHRP